MNERVNVLLIEDDPAYVRFLQETFREIPDNPFRLRIAHRLEEGLEILTREKVDGILLDLMLPDSHMLDTLRKVVEQFPQVPIVVLTALQDEQIGLSAVQLGAQDYLFKGDVSGPLLSRSLRYAIERKQAEEAVKQLNRNLQLMNSITRHDLLNQLTVILGYLHLMEDDQACQSCRRYLDSIGKAAEAIQTQIEFTREYQNIGSESAQWQKLRETILRAVHIYPSDLRTVSVSIAGEEEEIYADPMLEKIFYNLLDNSLRHGGPVTQIRVSWQERDDGLELVWEDNGTGISPDARKRLFQRGTGTKRGLGLFLIRNILAITHMDIRETGEPGTGARFAIRIPRGYFRTPALQEGGGS